MPGLRRLRSPSRSSAPCKESVSGAQSADAPRRHCDRALLCSLSHRRHALKLATIGRKSSDGRNARQEARRHTGMTTWPRRAWLRGISASILARCIARRVCAGQRRTRGCIAGHARWLGGRAGRPAAASAGHAARRRYGIANLPARACTSASGRIRAHMERLAQA